MNLFREHIRRSLANSNLQAALDANAERRMAGRLAAFASIPDHQERRRRAHAIKADVVARLDEYLDKFIEKVAENGIQVHRAADSAEAVQIVLDIVQGSSRRRTGNDTSEVLVAKSKSMVSEEINLNHALADHHIRAVETDLGEYIVQLRGERPSHIITPAVHLRRGDVGKLFEQKLGIPYTEDIPTLTTTARRVLRDVFLTADVGLSGVNFGVAETGTLCVVTNEGNGRMCTTVPPIHIALMGIERLVPTLDDLALFLSLLPRSATGQKLSVYTSLIHAPRRLPTGLKPGDPDGPLERHLVLLDNGRSRLRTSSLSEILYCIRCGACLNACPVFREIGGHAYRGVDGSIAPYPGPIGSVVSPGLSGCENFGHLAQASSLCGACKEACPVDIDLPGLLLRIRAGSSPRTVQGNAGEGTGVPYLLKLGLKAFRLAARSPSLFALGQRVLGLGARLISPRRDWMRLPALTGWGYSKDFPRPAVKPFRVRFHQESQSISHPASAEDAKVSRIAGKTETPRPVKVDLVEQFISELQALGGSAVRVAERDLPARLVEFLHGRGVNRLLVDTVGAGFIPAQAEGIELVRQPDPSIRVGLTGALAGIANTGTLVIVGGEGSPLTASLLPDVHIAILRASDIHADLPEVLNLEKIRQASAAVLVTGPSRTADIEMTLTIGVHGPGELHVFLIDDSAGV